MKLSIGFSPCPNDTFIFDALVHDQCAEPQSYGLEDKIEWNAQLEDVQTLNEWALEGKLDVTKLSYGTFFQVQDTYELLEAGSALGRGVGPLLIARNPWTEEEKQELLQGSNFSQELVLIPGQLTTANLLLSFSFPHLTNRKFCLFSQIEEELLNGNANLGVIIHENRFTYQQKGLHLIADLGALWEQKTNSPIPLGGIVVRKTLPQAVKTAINQMIQDSLKKSWKTYPTLSPYVQSNAQEMEPSVMKQHIDLYVNEYTNSLGAQGRKAIEVMENIFHQLQA